MAPRRLVRAAATLRLAVRRNNDCRVRFSAGTRRTQASISLVVLEINGDVKLTCQHLKLRVHIVTQTVLAILLVMMLTIACPSLSGPRPSSLTFTLLRSHHVVHPLTMVQK
ncbi:hypothetical protein E2C01_033601 [Portunus trituberculatus]|uniref:Uncharacterized protein n=1 Tax=Portunus trituberculatus TaxID=210409 RepID=A0A5B7F4I5_PORTR|nr:hypothetical protein [Portunus trituberculatus]